MFWRESLARRILQRAGGRIAGDCSTLHNWTQRQHNFVFGSAAVSMETMITIWNLEPGWETYLVTFCFNQMSQVWGQAGLGSPRSEGLSLKLEKYIYLYHANQPHPVCVFEIIDYYLTFCSIKWQLFGTWASLGWWAANDCKKYLHNIDRGPTIAAAVPPSDTGTGVISNEFSHFLPCHKPKGFKCFKVNNVHVSKK